MKKLAASFLVLTFSALIFTALLQIQMTRHNIDLILVEYVVILLGPLSAFIFLTQGILNLIILVLVKCTAPLFLFGWFKSFRADSVGTYKSTIPVFAWVFSGYCLSAWGAFFVDYPHF